MNGRSHMLIMRQHPCYKPTKLWSAANLHCYGEYREWMKANHCGQTMIPHYTAAVRWVFCLIDKPYWQIDLDVDIAAVQTYIDQHFESGLTRQSYRNGLKRFVIFLRLKCHLDRPKPEVHWDTYIGSLAKSIGQDVQTFITHLQTRWPTDKCHERTLDNTAALTRPLRHIAAQGQLRTWRDLTPQRWWHYTEMRLTEGIATRTLNVELHLLHSCLRFLMDLDRPVCERFMRVAPFKPTHTLPKDAPIDHMRQVLQAAQTKALRQPINQGRLGRLDLAWMLLMLHCGLRTGEVRRLRLGDIDWQRRFVRLEQSKGLKDRVVPMSDAVIQALQAYLAVRGPSDIMPAELFVFQHKPLSRNFCRHRLMFYKRKVGVYITPHQFRHTCATLLLNAGAPVTTVKLILGHVHIDTTLGYARVYDGTLAADYHRAMLSIERMLNLTPHAQVIEAPLTPAHIVALLDSLKTTGTLNVQQLDTLATARAAVVGLEKPA